MAPRWPQNGPKMVPKRLQGDPKIGVSCKRSANFAKSAMPSQTYSPRGPKVALRRLKTAQDEPRWSQDGPRWPKMARRWPQDGAKMGPRRSQDGNNLAPGPLSDVAELHIFPDGPKWSKLASRVGEVRFLAGLCSTFAVLQLHQNCPPLNSPASRQSRNHKVCSK